MNANSFQDLTGREWTIEANLGTFHRILEKTSLDVHHLQKFGESWTKITVDDDIAEAVIWAAISEAAGGDKHAWRCQMSGATLAAARETLLAAICETFPTRAECYREIAGKIHEVTQAAWNKVADLLAEIPSDPTALRRFAKNLNKQPRRSR